LGKIGCAWLVVGVLSFAASGARAEVTAMSMSYRNFARESEDARVRDLISSHVHAADAAKAQWSYDADQRLLPSNSVSWFETQLTYIQLLRERFLSYFYKARSDDAGVRQEMWNLRAAALEAGQPEPLGVIAQHYVQMRKDNLEACAKFADWAKKSAAAAQDLELRARRLLAQGGMAREEYNYYLELLELGQEAVNGAYAELQKGQKLLEEAQSDLAQVNP
jgi:hypothetical protein